MDSARTRKKMETKMRNGKAEGIKKDGIGIVFIENVPVRVFTLKTNGPISRKHFN